MPHDSLPDATRTRLARVPARSLPTGSAIAAQHPLPAPGARLTGGLLHEWQRRNAAASMPLALHQLVVAGNLDNLQLAIGAMSREPVPRNLARPRSAAASAPRARGVTPPAGLGYHGPVFMDSDIYKTLEAIGWELGSPAAAIAGGEDPRAGRTRASRPGARTALGARSARRHRHCSPASSARTAT